MQNDSSSTWSTAAPTSGEDFARFLEFHDLDLDLSAFDDQAQVSAQSQDVSDHHGMKQDYDAAAYYDQLHHVAIQKDGSTGDLRGQMTGLHVGSSTHSLSNGYQQQMYYQNRIPPTPSSTDIHGRQSQSLVDAQQASMYEAQVRKQQEQMTFTPLGTPAVTPMDTHFQIRDYTVPGEYFSPLASPAMHPQNHQSDTSMYYPFHMSDVSETSSPVDMTFDPSLIPTSAPRRQQKKRSPGRPTKPGARSIKQSPAMKAQKKKQSSTSIPAKDLQDVIANSRPGTSSGSNSLGLPATIISSESPEPLLDMMPPPTIPSAHRSPYITPGSQSAPIKSQHNPATPTSLLKMKDTSNMQDLSLGAAAIDSQDVAMTDATTPTISALQTNVYTPFSAMSPPSTAATPRMKSKAADLKSTSKSNKRNISTHASPALRPKISPSIKPLLPDGILNAETSALLLASKSNYQNILDGTHLPGVIYPEALSENLTSKRTSHKIAEQGRRNRINTALQEIAALLPQSPTSIGDGSVAAQASSKASTVEQAIDYIKLLQAEVKQTKEKLAISENKLREIESPEGGVVSAVITPSGQSDVGEFTLDTEEATL